MRTLGSIALVGLLFGAAAVAEEKTELVYVRGTITEVKPANDEAKKNGRLGIFLVAGKREADTSSDTAWVTVTGKTKIEKLAGKDKKEAKFDDLKKGAKVEVAITGVVAKSDPPQVEATVILILEEGK